MKKLIIFLIGYSLGAIIVASFTDSYVGLELKIISNTLAVATYHWWRTYVVN